MRLGATSLSITRPLGLRSFLDFGTYVLSSASNVNEGDTLTVTVNTIGVPSGTVLYWETTNITTSDSDFTTTSGSVQIINGTGNFTVGAVADSTTEGAETFGITLRRSSPAGPIVASTTNKTINDTSQSPPPPSYSASSPSSVNEGSALVCTVTTTNVADSTTLYWTTSHTSTTDADFTANSGSFTITSNSGTFNVTPTADATTEGAETFTVQIRTGSTSGTIVATLPGITVNDTSLTPTYSFSSASSVDEGASLACTVTTTNVADSTTLYWTINHTTTSAADFTSTSGSFTVTSNSGTFNIYAASDTLVTEGAETFTVEIRTGSTSGTIVETSSSITVNDIAAGWDINTATYDSKSNRSGGFGNNRSFTIAGDGTRVYFGRRLYQAPSWRTRWYQWTLATPWDVTSTATSNGSQLISIDAGKGMSWKSDGTRFYRCYSTGAIRQWTVPSSDAWNMMNASKTFDGETNFSSYGQPKDIQWSADGTKCFIFFDTPNDRVRLFTVSTAWDITSTVTFVSTSPILTNRKDMEMKPDGTKVYFADTGTATFYQHDLTTAFDPTTISTTPTYTKAITSQTGGGTLHGVRFKPDGTELVTYSTYFGQMYKYTI